MLNNLTIATTVVPSIEAATIGVESNESFGETNDGRDTTNKFECKVKSLPNEMIRRIILMPRIFIISYSIVFQGRMLRRLLKLQQSFGLWITIGIFGILYLSYTPRKVLE